MEFIEQKLDDYVCEHTSAENELLYELNRKTHTHILQPRMLSGHFQGRLLSMLSNMIKPKYILELGTYTGYSALCLLEGMQENGVLYTLDINEELEDFVEEFVQKANAQDKIKHLIGPALEIIPTLEEQFDLVFIDADKENYSAYYDMIFDKVAIGGYILADNVLWSGKVIDEKSFDDKDTKLLRAYNKMVQEDPRVENILLPIRDGIMIARKLKN